MKHSPTTIDELVSRMHKRGAQQGSENARRSFRKAGLSDEWIGRAMHNPRQATAAPTIEWSK